MGSSGEKQRHGRGGVEVQEPSTLQRYLILPTVLISGPNKAVFASNFVYSLPARHIHCALLHNFLREGKLGKESESKQSVYHLFWYR